MAISNSISFNWSSGSANSINQTVLLSGNTCVIDQFTAAEDATTQFALAWTNANLQSIVILTDQPLTLKTNSSGSPQDTIVLSANSPFVWYAGSGVANPFIGNVTTSYWVNASEVNAATVNVRMLTNS